MKNTFYPLILLLFVLGCSSTGYEVVVESYEDGNPKLVRYYRDENRQDLLREIQYYEDGKVYIEGQYKDNEREGKWTAWYRNGNIWSTGEYQKGMENGLKTVYHENGNKYYEGHVVDDERVGE